MFFEQLTTAFWSVFGVAMRPCAEKQYFLGKIAIIFYSNDAQSTVTEVVRIDLAVCVSVVDHLVRRVSAQVNGGNSEHRMNHG